MACGLAFKSLETLMINILILPNFTFLILIDPSFNLKLNLNQHQHSYSSYPPSLFLRPIFHPLHFQIDLNSHIMLPMAFG